jgi:hypothetical protein
MPRWHFRFQARKTAAHAVLTRLLPKLPSFLPKTTCSAAVSQHWQTGAPRCPALRGAQYPRHMPSRLFRRKPGLQAAHWLQVHREKSIIFPPAHMQRSSKPAFSLKPQLRQKRKDIPPAKPVLLQTEIPAANDMHPNSVKRFGAIFYLHFTPIQIDLPDKRKVPPTLLSSGEPSSL